MARISDTVLEEIKARLPIEELIGSRLSLQRKGSVYKACCPFHQEKTPSFTVNPVRGRYHCFGCGADGDIFKFIQLQDGLTFGEAVRQLAERAGITITAETDVQALLRNKLHEIYIGVAVFYQKCLALKSAAGAREYLLSRKIPEETVRRFGIGYAPRQKDTLLKWADKNGYSVDDMVDAGLLVPPNRENSTSYFDRFQGRLMFPICDHMGKVCAFSGRILDASHPAKYVNSPETPIFTKSKILYALDKAREKIIRSPRRQAIVCEGQIDVIRCHSAGFDVAVASQGTAFGEHHADLLKRYADTVVLAFDGDGAGIKAALKTGRLLLEREIPVRVIELPPGEDPDSFIREKGAAAFQSSLDQARSIIAYQIEHLRAAEERPGDIDAVRRLADGVIETLAGCPGAVMRAHLLQEAAGLLGLPLSALEEDLAKYKSILEQKKSYVRTVPETPQIPTAENDAPPLTDPNEYGDPESEIIAPEQIEPVKKRSESRVDSVCEALAELLLHHPRNQTLREMIRSYLPPEIIPHPFTRRLVEFLLSEENRTGAVVPPSGDNPIFAAYLDKLLTREERMQPAGEITPEEAAQDFIRQIWVSSLELRRDFLKGSHETADVKLRLELTFFIKKIQTFGWETARIFLTPNTPVLPVFTSAAAAASLKGPVTVDKIARSAPIQPQAPTATAPFDEELPD